MLQEWRPITDYENDPADLADQELGALSRVWIERRDTLGESVSLNDFSERLNREWAIETGLIERLYTLDRGITELMIERGVNAALIPHRSVDDPEHAVALIDDQQAAIENVFAFVKSERSLSTSYIKELHHLFTRNQEFAEGRDQFGRKSKVSLIRGDYKCLPNNPTRPDGTTHPYCPPEHVASEMDQLLELHQSHDKVAPEVEAAWLHHRFVQIHPFQDGNGRLARALATLIFIKFDWLPLVVRDRERDGYIRALEAADDGDLKPLVSFFSGIQKREFINALSILHNMEEEVRVDARIRAIGQRLARRRDALKEEWETAKSSAGRLHALAKHRMEEVRSLLDESLGGQGFVFFVADASDQDNRSHYYQRQIVSSARTLGYFADRQHYRSWVLLGARDVGDVGQSCILVAFHSIGQEFQGVLACSGTWFRRVPADDGRRESEGETALCDEVFQINYREAPEQIEERFRVWLEPVLERGLALWEATGL